MKKLVFILAVLIPLIAVGQSTVIVGGGGSSPITKSGSNLGFTTGSFGVGTLNPSSRLSVISLDTLQMLSSELTTNGAFTTNLIGWDTTGWTWNTGGALHSTGTNPLQQDVTVATGFYYVVEVNTTAPTVGSAVLALGSIAGSVTISGTYTDYTFCWYSSSNATIKLKITPTSTYNGKINNISFKRLVQDRPSDIGIYNQSGNAELDLRGGGYGYYNALYGYDVGSKLSNGKYNTQLGYMAGKYNTSGTNNVLIGYKSATANYQLDRSVIIGSEAGLNSSAQGYDNVIIGFQSGYTAVGIGNTLLGAGVGRLFTTGSYNMLLGNGVFGSNSEGNENVLIGRAVASAGTGASYYNTAIGANAGRALTTSGYYNTFAGYKAGYSNTSGATNVFIGHSAGYSNTTASGSVCIGDSAGYSNTTANKLFIHNGPSATPLIGGDFSTGVATITYCLQLTPIAAPTWTPAEGQIYADTDHHLYYYNGSTWVQLDN